MTVREIKGIRKGGRITVDGQVWMEEERQAMGRRGWIHWSSERGSIWGRKIDGGKGDRGQQRPEAD